MFQTLYAQESAPAPAPAKTPGKTQEGPSFLFIMIIMILIFYFLLIRPQQKKQKEMEKRRSAVKKGDKIVTGGGIFGKVVRVKEETGSVFVEIASNVQIEIARSTIMQVIPPEEEKPKK